MCVRLRFIFGPVNMLPENRSNNFPAGSHSKDKYKLERLDCKQGSVRNIRKFQTNIGLVMLEQGPLLTIPAFERKTI